ncbi:hypothetical protein [Lysobacter sp. Hz 25]|uniref:hypothetical protein n=1 Tax=Lysobacter sp. Hz 25 TaxID=3383698 RepID=UPI0038D3E45C
MAVVRGGRPGWIVSRPRTRWHTPFAERFGSVGDAHCVGGDAAREKRREPRAMSNRVDALRLRYTDSRPQARIDGGMCALETSLKTAGKKV